MLILKVFDMLTLERIESLPKDEDYPAAFVLEPFNSDNIKNGRVTVDFERGSVDIWSCGWWCDVELKLYEYFIDWLNPTPEENTLWTLETGLEPIEIYVEQMEKMMKEFK